MKNRIINLLFIGLLVSIVISCAKSKENKLIGKWTLIDYNNPQNDNTTWEFKADGTLWTKKDSLYTDTAEYAFKTESMRYYVDIVGLGPTKTDDDWDGRYHIDKLKKDILMLQCQDPFLRWEFVKSE